LKILFKKGRRKKSSSSKGGILQNLHLGAVMGSSFPSLSLATNGVQGGEFLLLSSLTSWNLGFEWKIAAKPTAMHRKGGSIERRDRARMKDGMPLLGIGRNLEKDGIDLQRPNVSLGVFLDLKHRYRVMRPALHGRSWMGSMGSCLKVVNGCDSGGKLPGMEGLRHVYSHIHTVRKKEAELPRVWFLLWRFDTTKGAWYVVAEDRSSRGHYKIHGGLYKGNLLNYPIGTIYIRTGTFFSLKKGLQSALSYRGSRGRPRSFFWMDGARTYLMSMAHRTSHFSEPYLRNVGVFRCG